MKARTLAVLAALAAILPRLGLLRWPLISDEGAYAYTARAWARGATLYADVWSDRPQGIFAAYRLGQLVLGESAIAIRLHAALWCAMTAVALASIARRVAGPRVAVLAVLCYALYAPAPAIEGFTANAEIFATAAGLVGAALLLDGRAAWAGLAVGAAIMLKPSGLGALGFSIAALIWTRSPRATWLRFLGGAALLPLACLAHGLATVGAARYLDAIVGFRLGLALTGRGGHLDAMPPLAGTAVVWAPLAALGLLGFLRAEREARRTIAALLISALLGIALGGRWFAHYLIHAVPALALAAALGAHALLEQRRRLGQLVIAALAIAGLAPIAEASLGDPRAGSWALYHRAGYVIAEDVAAHVREHSDPRDPLLVAFAEAELYYLADRPAVTPYLFRIELLHRAGAYEQLVEAVERRQPRYVLMLDLPLDERDPERRFGAALARGYTVERSWGPIALYARR